MPLLSEVYKEEDVYIFNQQECEKCSFSTKNKRNSEKHKKSYHEEIGFRCAQCDHISTRKESLTLHIRNIPEGVKF